MAFEPSDAKFKTTLDKDSQKLAKTQLGENNDKDRQLAVQSLRQWVLQQPWLKTPTDFGFLLRFLRVRKYSQLGARQTLENYWTARTKYPQWFRNIDPADPAMLELLKTGFYYCPMVRDKKGRRLIIERPEALDFETMKKKYGVDILFKLIVLVCEWLNRDENIQVNGVSVLMDMGNSSLAHNMTVYSPENSKRMMHYYQNALPTRIKGVHLYREPTFIDMIYSMVAPMMKQKLKDRLYFHGNNLTKVYEEIDMSVLPDEYLPDEYDGPSVGPAKQVVDEMIADMLKPEFRNYITNLSSERYGVDLEAKSRTHVPTQSFRKLNMD